MATGAAPEHQLLDDSVVPEETEATVRAQDQLCLLCCGDTHGNYVARIVPLTSVGESKMQWMKRCGLVQEEWTRNGTDNLMFLCANHKHGFALNWFCFPPCVEDLEAMISQEEADMFYRRVVVSSGLPDPGRTPLPLDKFSGRFEFVWVGRPAGALSFAVGDGISLCYLDRDNSRFPLTLCVSPPNARLNKKRDFPSVAVLDESPFRIVYTIDNGHVDDGGGQTPLDMTKVNPYALFAHALSAVGRLCGPFEFFSTSPSHSIIPGAESPPRAKPGVLRVIEPLLVRLRTLYNRTPTWDEGAKLRAAPLLDPGIHVSGNEREPVPSREGAVCVRWFVSHDRLVFESVEEGQGEGAALYDTRNLGLLARVKDGHLVIQRQEDDHVVSDSDGLYEPGFSLDC
ncbi:hypothetical protein AURDEDRAFT_162414 [Auricularia subglabra TFB-10046 SS5]|nr:hypothetical protein AURDEDRAFT_162414 [Auricularia subglabra TFB-10046 SS5]